MAVIIYDGKAIIPGGTVTATRNNIRSNNGIVIGKTYAITYNGVIVADKGSPSSTGTFHTGTGNPADENIGDTAKLASILAKQKAIRELFSNDGLLFEIQPWDGSTPTTFNPRILSITFQESIWYNTCSYTITMEADQVYPLDQTAFEQHLSDVNETWSIETDDTPEGLLKPRTYRLNHNVSAVGKSFYNEAGDLVKEAWEWARDYVIARLGYNSTIATSSGVNNLPAYYGGFNHIRNENIDKTNGSFGVVESWILTSGTYIEDFTVNVQRSEIGLDKVSIEGSINGLEERDSNMNLTTTKYDNAVEGWNTASGLALLRAQYYSGKTLNIKPLSTSYQVNPIAGRIGYTFEYDNRPSNLITNTISEVVSIHGTAGVQLFAAIPVIERTKGPFLQDMESYLPAELNLNIEMVFDPSYMPSNASISDRINTYDPFRRNPQSGEIDSIINAATPVGNALNNINGLATTSFVSNKSKSWNPSEKRASLNITWIYE